MMTRGCLCQIFAAGLCTGSGAGTAWVLSAVPLLPAVAVLCHCGLQHAAGVDYHLPHRHRGHCRLPGDPRAVWHRGRRGALTGWCCAAPWAAVVCVCAERQPRHESCWLCFSERGEAEPATLLLLPSSICSAAWCWLVLGWVTAARSLVTAFSACGLGTQCGLSPFSSGWLGPVTLL